MREQYFILDLFYLAILKKELALREVEVEIKRRPPVVMASILRAGSLGSELKVGSGRGGEEDKRTSSMDLSLHTVSIFTESDPGSPPGFTVSPYPLNLNGCLQKQAGTQRRCLSHISKRESGQS